MDVLKKIGNVLTILLAIVLSLVLTVVLIVIPVLSAVSSFTQGETLHQVMGEIDYSEILSSAVVGSGVVTMDELNMDEISTDEELSENVLSAAQEQGISVDIVEDIMCSDAVGEVLELYMDDAFAALEGDAGEVSLTPEALQEIAGEHMDELADIAKEFLGEEAGLTDAQVNELVSQIVEENADTIIEMLPPVEELLPIQHETVSTQSEESIDVLVNLLNGTSVMAVIIAAVVLSVLILLCRIKKFKGFLWLGVVYLISAGLTLIGSTVLDGSGLTELFDMGVATTVVGPVLSVLASKLRESAVIIAVCAVVFILIYAIGRAVLKRKTETAEA